MNKKYPAYLESDGDRINLVALETLSSSLIVQVVLKPERKPVVGRKYTIRIDGVSKYQSPHRFNYKTLALEPATFVFVSEIDKIAPVVSADIHKVSTVSRYESCGPESFVAFSIQARDLSETLVKTTLRDLQSGIEHTIYLFPKRTGNETVVEVGYYMCDIGFDMKGDEAYQVTFSFQDICGNVSLGPKQTLMFQSPPTPRL